MRKTIILFLAIFLVITFCHAQQILQQLKVEKYTVTMLTISNSGSPVQQVININLTGKPLDAASRVTSATIQVTTQEVPALPPFYNTAGNSIIVYANKNYYPTVMDMINRSLENGKYKLVLKFFSDATAGTTTAEFSITK